MENDQLSTNSSSLKSLLMEGKAEERGSGVGESTSVGRILSGALSIGFLERYHVAVPYWLLYYVNAFLFSFAWTRRT